MSHRGTALFFLAAVASCANRADIREQVCSPGAGRACSCETGGTGSQSCLEGGTGWGPCLGCVEVEAPDAGSPPDATCRPCLTTEDCAPTGLCVQYSDSDYCGEPCHRANDCEDDQQCEEATTYDGALVLVCTPRSGTCAPDPCGSCPPGTHCDHASGECIAFPEPATDAADVPDVKNDAGDAVIDLLDTGQDFKEIPDPGDPGADPADPGKESIDPGPDVSDPGKDSLDPGQVAPDADWCGAMAAPPVLACCTACLKGSVDCQSNGCYGGWWCDSVACKCHQPPTTCDAPVDLDPPTGSVGPTGGKVSRLHFAIVGDTRPPDKDKTATYPTAIIQKIYAGIEAIDPHAQFVIATGDYMFASPGNDQAAAQMAIYMQAAKQFIGPIFAAIGNHECTGWTASNCASGPTTNYQAWFDALVKPLGKDKPYYAIPISGTDGSFDAKVVVVACNAWDAGQKAWFASEMAKPTTFTFVVRHQPSGAYNAPCVPDTDAVLAKEPYSLLIVGHTHTFKHYDRILVIGNGGAPMAGSGHGFAIVDQLPWGGLRITRYHWDSWEAMEVFTVQ